MRAWLIVATFVALGAGGFLLVTHGKSSKAPARAAHAEELGELRQEVDALRHQVGSAQALGMAALAHNAPSAQAPAAAAPEAKDQAAAEAPAPDPLTQPGPEQQVENFKSYFDQLDALRGPATDTALAAKVDDAVATYDWKLVSGVAPTTHAVQCGNGYCRVSLTFKELQEAETARTGLSMAAGPILGRMSVYLDPKTLKVEGYFAQVDKPFPPFPETDALVQRAL